jgi:hypothetical protein
MGPEVRAGVEDEDVVEILVNSDGSLWFDRHSSEAVKESQIRGRFVGLAGRQ